jgi:membrane-bound serine protease (ClpP class)
MSILSRGLATIRASWIYFMMAALVPGIVLPQPQTTPEDALEPADRFAIMLDVEGPIGPATMAFVVDTLEAAATQPAELVIIRMDTPGGLDASTRDIIKSILNSPVPVATFVTPEGARAASAGTYILYASHIAAMSPATHLGAATPVAIAPGNSAPPGEEPPPQSGESEDLSAGEPGENSPLPSPGSAMERKAINDSVAYLRGLAARRGRNADWAEKAVREAASITAAEALELGVIDLVAQNLDDLLEQINGKTVDVQGRERILDTGSLRIETMEPDWKSELLAVITSPTIAYVLLLIGIYGLILEGYHPGAIVPGVVGAICLLVALYAFQMLPVNYAGFALIVLGIILMIGEVMAPSFGALGIGGVIAMVIGSIILIDTDVPGFAVSRPLIGAIALTSSLGLMAIIGFAVRARQRPVVSGREEMLGAMGTALLDFERRGQVFVHGERWSAVSSAALREGEAIVVTGIDGLTLEVRPASGPGPDYPTKE